MNKRGKLNDKQVSKYVNQSVKQCGTSENQETHLYLF